MLVLLRYILCLKETDYNKKLVNEVADVFVDNALLVDQEKQLKVINNGTKSKCFYLKHIVSSVI